MGFSGLLDCDKMYGIQLKRILKLTSALIGDVMKEAENSKNLEFSWFIGYNFVINHDFFMAFWKIMLNNRYNRNIK